MLSCFFIRIVLTTPLNSKSPINDHIVKHGDGVKVVALWVEDARKSYEETTKRGAKPYMQPTQEEDENGYVIQLFEKKVVSKEAILGIYFIKNFRNIISLQGLFNEVIIAYRNTPRY